MKPAPVAALLLSMACGGCSMALDDSSGVYAAQPGKYDFLDCPGLLKVRQTQTAREAEITALMERANQGGGGGVVNALVYRDQLNTVRADLQSAQRAADEKACAPDGNATGR